MRDFMQLTRENLNTTSWQEVWMAVRHGKLEYPEKQKALLPRGAMLFGTPLPDVEYPPITLLSFLNPINFTHPDLVLTFRMEDHRGGASHVSIIHMTVVKTSKDHFHFHYLIRLVLLQELITW
jgi:hypothetical protein